MGRMKFLAIISILVLVVIFGVMFVGKFVSFPNPITSQVNDMSDDTRDVDKTIELREVYVENSSFFKDVSFEQPHDILLTSYGSILVSDAKANCLYEFDIDGNYIGKIGKTGNGEVEFNFPTALCEHDGNIIVVDNFNDRVQILSGKTYKYLDQISLDTKLISDSTYYKSIVSDGDSAIYISGNFMYMGDAYVKKIIIDQNNPRYKEIQVIAPLCGKLYYDNNEDTLYMAETYELKSSNGSYKRMRGTHYLRAFDVVNGKENIVFEFPVKYMPSALFKTNEGFISISLTRETIDRFDADGEYIDTIFMADKNKGFHYAKMSDDGVIYLSCTYMGRVLKLSMNQ